LAGRNQFTFYSSFWETAKRIKSKAARADLYDTICRYALEGEEPDLDKLPESVAVAFINAKPNLDASRKKAENGKHGGSKPKANGKQTESKPKQHASEKENEKEKENEIEREGEKEKKQTPPLDGSLFTRFWEAFPNKLGREKAWEAWKKLNPDKAMAELLTSTLELWKRSEKWRNKAGDFQYAPRAEAFLSDDGYWKYPPGAEGIPKGASGELGAAELEAIQRVLRYGGDQLSDSDVENIRRMMNEPDN
jgi:hypothetical protein